MRRFVLGDIHGEYEYLLDVLKKSGFDSEKDLLIQIGDIVDRGPEPFKCMDKLLEIKNLVLIKGNHDDTFISYTEDKMGYHSLGMNNSNGAGITVQKWNKLNKQEKAYYKREIFDLQIPYFITDDNIMFVHGGFDREKKLEDHEEVEFYWDRELVMEAMSCTGNQKLKTIYDFKKIFIGHTPTIYWNITDPIRRGGVINIDTGSGKTGPLTIMDVDTEEYWQSNHNFLIDKNYVIIKENKENSIEGEGEE